MKKFLFLLIALATIIPTINGIVINEIMYDPNGSDSDREWVEIYNEKPTQQDITGFQFVESETAHSLSAYSGDLVLEPYEYAVIVDSPDLFLVDYPEYSGTIIDSSWTALSNTGEVLEIIDSAGNVKDFVNYSSSWGGTSPYSLELINPNQDNSKKENWAESAQEKGTPGEINSVYNNTTQVPEFSVLTMVIALIAGAAIFFFVKK